MKSTGSTHRRTPNTTWPRKANSQHAVLKRIQTVTRELGALQAEMHGELADPVRGKASQFFEDSAAVEALNLFKAELDQLRRILWFYIDEAAKKPRTGTGHDQQAQRLERVTDLLRALSPQADGPAVAGESGSFFERLNCVIDTYMQEKKPVEAETKATARRDAKVFS